MVFNSSYALELHYESWKCDKNKCFIIFSI